MLARYGAERMTRTCTPPLPQMIEPCYYLYMDGIHIQITCMVRPLVYHFAWGSMRAKPVLVGGVAARLEQLLCEKATTMALRLRAIEIRPALVYVATEAPPHLAPHSIVCGLKAHSSGILRREFKELT